MARKPKPAPEAKPEEPKAAAPAETPAAEASLAAVVSAVEAPPPAAEAPLQPPSPAPPPPSEPRTEPQGVLVVTGPKRGRWRAGWHFGPEPRRIPLAGLTEDERAAIESDPALVVSVETEA